MLACTLRRPLQRAAAWLALVALCLGAAVPTLAQALGTPRAAWSELCSTAISARASQVGAPMSDGALLAHLFQHCGDCLTQGGTGGDTAAPTAALAWVATGAEAGPLPVAVAAAPHGAPPWPRALSRAPPHPTLP